MYPPNNSQEILQRLKNDDQLAIKEIFHSYYGLVFKTIVRLCNDATLTEDLAQNVFMRFWEKRQQLNIKGPLAPYIKRMAINEALGYLRKNKLATEEIEEQTLPNLYANDADQDLLYEEVKEVLGQAVQKLPPRCQTVFKLSRYEELSYKEISKEMDISVKTVENQMGRALKLLRKMLSGYLHFFF